MKKITIVSLCCLFAAQTLLAEEIPVKQVLEPYIQNGDLTGIVTVTANRNKVLQVDSLGYANIDEKIQMNHDTLFWIASQSKPIAAAGVMILVDEGKLNLDDPVTKYLPELNELRVAVNASSGVTVLVPLERQITIRNLLSHSSGMIWNTTLQQKHKIDVLPFSKTLTICASTPLKAQPNTEYSYSNMGVNVAATVVERITGIPFEKFLEQRIFQPLGMKDTTFYPSDEQVKRLAQVYAKGDGNKLRQSDTGQLTYPLNNNPTRYPEAAGGLFSTPDDLVKFYQMLLNECEYHDAKILKPESVREMWKNQTEHLKQHYGLGLTTSEGRYGHAGACGTDSVVDTNNDLVYLYFVQEQGLPKSNEAKQKFYNCVRENVEKLKK
ncbi:MAG: beta-lactamase family protein [Planctomycetaceae bacterium]|nr:beta-lactamase family protein [Planctomycetaceae bacterium]